jgi:hypothetical protein
MSLFLTGERRPLLLAVSLAAALALTTVSCSGGSTTAESPANDTTVTAAASDETSSTSASTSTSDTVISTDSGSSPDPSALLTAEDIEKVSGLTGVRSTPRDPSRGAGGDLNFATDEGQAVLMANFGDGELFEDFEDTPNYREPLSGLGDAAFVGPAEDIMPTLYQLGFKEGDRTGLFTTYFKEGSGSTVLTMDEMQELAEIVMSRW